MRTAAVMGLVALTELAAHFLSLGWGVMTLLAAFAWVGLSGASVAAKARSTEDRVNNLIPVVGAASTLAGNAFPKSGGTVSGNVVVTGTHQVNGNMSVGGSHTVTGQINGSNVSLSGGMTDFGHTSHGNVSIDNNLAVSGTLNGGGGGTVEATSIHSGGTILADGQINASGAMSASNFGGPYQGGQAAVSTLSGTVTVTQCASAINGIIARLNSSGLI